MTVVTDEYNSRTKEKYGEFHRVVFWGNAAERVGQYLKKGNGIALEGSLRTRKWTDSSGVEKYTTEVHCFNFEFVPQDKNNGNGQAAPKQNPAPQQPAKQQDNIFDDDVPF